MDLRDYYKDLTSNLRRRKKRFPKRPTKLIVFTRPLKIFLSLTHLCDHRTPSALPSSLSFLEQVLNSLLYFLFFKTQF